MAFSDQKVHSRIASWQDAKPSSGNQTNASNTKPFHGMLHMQTLSGHSEDYGLPQAGSRTEHRAKQAGVHISKEIVELCDIIQEIGQEQPDGAYAVRFGDLFEMYTRISNKLVGMLRRARKQGFVQFEGEMLFQRKDDDVLIFLIRTPEELEVDLAKRQAELMYPSLQ